MLKNLTSRILSDSLLGGNQQGTADRALSAANAEGDKPPTFVIGKSEKPRCFTGVLSCHGDTAHRKKAAWTVLYWRNG